jgi:cobalt-zinc-cadmium efflux system outer membrane protein
LDRIAKCLLLGCAACATVDARPDQAEARWQIQETTGRSEVFDPEAPVLTAIELDAALADGLTLDETLRLALLNNRRLQAGFARLGVARAEWVQAGLLRNPSLGFAFLLPSSGGSPQITANLAQSLVEIWELPARKRIARAELAQPLFEVSHFAGQLVAEVTNAYFQGVAARETRSVAGEGLELAGRQLAAVRRQVEGGVATEVEAQITASAVLTAELAFRSSEREEITVKRRLAALLSLEGDLQDVELSEPLPPPDVLRPDREELVERSLRQRLDLRASAAAVEAAIAQEEYEKRRVLPALEAGLAVERPEGGAEPDLLLGPAVSLEIPLFDQNQARAARAEYRRQTLEKEHEALRSEIAQGVRAACDRADTAARTAAFVAEELLPQAERSLQLARKAHELGDTTVLAMLARQRAVLAARQHLLEALLEAARARVELERQSGGPLEKRPAPEGDGRPRDRSGS